MGLTELLPVRQQGLHRLGRIVLTVHARQAVAQRSADGAGIGIVDLPPAAGIVQPDGHLSRQTRDEIELGRPVREGAGGLPLIDDLVGQAHGIAYRLRARDLVVVRAGRIAEGDRLRGIEDGGVLKHPALEPAGVLERDVRVVHA